VILKLDRSYKSDIPIMFKASMRIENLVSDSPHDHGKVVFSSCRLFFPRVYLGPIPYLLNSILDLMLSLWACVCIKEVGGAQLQIKEVGSWAPPTSFIHTQAHSDRCLFQPDVFLI